MKTKRRNTQNLQKHTKTCRKHRNTQKTHRKTHIANSITTNNNLLYHTSSGNNFPKATAKQQNNKKTQKNTQKNTQKTQVISYVVCTYSHITKCVLSLSGLFGLWFGPLSLDTMSFVFYLVLFFLFFCFLFFILCFYFVKKINK
jgi:cation transport ATPase